MPTPRQTSVLALALALVVGCGSEPASVPFKPTDTSNLDDMKAQMQKNIKTKNFVNKEAKPAEKP